MDVAIQLSLETLRDLLIEEGGFLYGVSNEVNKVERELKTIHCFLMDADKWPDRHKTAILADWIAKLSDLASRAEDVLEKYAIEVTSRRGGNLIKKFKRATHILDEWLTVHQVGKEIEAIRSSLSNLTGRLGTMAPGGSSSSSTDDHQHLLRITFEHEIKQHFVGMEKDIASLVSLVMDRTRPNRVISIYGMGGLGKTTLARKIYNHRDVIHCFDARAWVCSTQQFQHKTVLSEILEQLVPDGDKGRISNMGQRELVKTLHDFQMQKICLIVIDDIWESDHWSILEPAFPIENGQCNVLLTTRNQKVGPRDCLHKLDHLTDDQGWELLGKIAFPSDYAPELDTKQSLVLEAIGRQMVQKCGGLPLAITVLGGILREKQTSSEWQRVSEDVDSYLKRGDEKVKQVLDLSYNSLPYYLKPCFLYLGCFPEDQEIDTERLYLLWIADCLISSEGKGKKETLRDVAERYLTELASRCMVQVRKHEYSSAYNKFKSCCLHDLMRDLCLAKGEEEGFFKVIHFLKRTSDATYVGTASRLAIHRDGDADNYFIRGEKMKNLRSLLVLQKVVSRMLTAVGSEDSVTDFNKLKRLRILVLENGRFVLPNDLGNLIHLRYLSFFNSVVEELPLSVSDLRYLQTLDLRGREFIKVPNAIYKMKRLRHVFVDSILVDGEYGKELTLDGLEELETLQCKNWVRVADIPKLTNLQTLTVAARDNDSLSMIVHHMSSGNSQLRETHLDIVYCNFSSGDGGSVIFGTMLMSPSLVTLRLYKCNGSSLPPYQQGMCTSLVDLKLCDCEIEGDVMELLGKFPMLKRLYLDGKTVPDTVMTCLATSFPQLKFLILDGLSNLERWVVDKGAMPNLSSLEISSCERLEMIPHGLRFVTTLQELETYMPKEFNDALRKGMNGRQGKDYHIICHVPSILLGDMPTILSP